MSTDTIIKREIYRHIKTGSISGDGGTTFIEGWGGLTIPREYDI